MPRFDLSSIKNSELIDRKNEKITIKHQCELLGINRTSVYKKEDPKKLHPMELFMRQLVDHLHTAEPTWGYRKITDWMNLYLDERVNRKRTLRIMRDMGIYAIYPKPNLSKRYHAKYTHPYLLRNKTITGTNQVWGVDITYIPMEKGFMYLFVIIDWYSRYIVDYEISSTMDKGFVLKCLRRAMKKQKPDIINSDQGGQFTNPDYIKLLKENGVRISMDGKGQCLDNAITERFFRTLKYDRIYVYEIRNPRELRNLLREYMVVYNHKRPHDSLGGIPPAYVYEIVEEQRKSA